MEGEQKIWKQKIKEKYGKRYNAISGKHETILEEPYRLQNESEVRTRILFRGDLLPNS